MIVINKSLSGQNFQLREGEVAEGRMLLPVAKRASQHLFSSPNFWACEDNCPINSSMLPYCSILKKDILNHSPLLPKMLSFNMSMPHQKVKSYPAFFDSHGWWYNLMMNVPLGYRFSSLGLKSFLKISFSIPFPELAPKATSNVILVSFIIGHPCLT